MDNRRFGVLCRHADGIALPYELQQEGCETYTYVEDKQYKNSYNGIIKKVSSIQELISRVGKDGIYIFDSVEQGKIGDGLRRSGRNVVGGMVFADNIELKRMVGINFMKDNGIKIPPTFEFKTKAEGIAFVKKNPERYVYKPDGNLSTAKTYVSKNAEDLISFMQKQTDNNPYILQLFIKGIELSTEVFFSDGNPILPPNNTIESKKAFTGNIYCKSGLGCATGCMSSLVWPLTDFNSKAVKEGIGKLFSALKKVKYSGPLDVNSIIDEKGNLYGLEITSRFGYSAIYALLELLNEPLSDLLSGIALGTAEEMPIKKEYGMTLRIGIPPAPMEIDDTNKEHTAPLFTSTAGQKVTMKNKDVSYYLLDVMLKNGELQTAGGDGWLMEVGAHGKSIEEVEKKIYMAASEISPDQKFFRVDAYNRAKEEIPKLAKLGYEVLNEKAT